MRPETQRHIPYHIMVILMAYMLFINFFTLNAQDIHFTMFNQAPLFINPAHTGNHNANWRLSVIYRDQWRAIGEPYTTASAGFDMPVSLANNQTITVGALLLNDQSGSQGLTQNKVYLSAGYLIQQEKSNIIIALQPGFVYRSRGAEGLTLPGDYSRPDGIFIPGGYENEKKGFADVNFGVLWRSNIGKFEPEAGLALRHINFPNESFDDKERLKAGYVLHGRMKSNITDHFFATPALLLMKQVSANQLLIGTDVGMNIYRRGTSLNEVNAGAYFRNGIGRNPDALALKAGMIMGNIDLNFCYDINLSKLNVAAGSNGTFEFSVVYRSITTVLTTYSIPCERL